MSRPGIGSHGATHGSVDSLNAALGFEVVADSLREVELPPVDIVYGIATGGVVPAALVALRLGVPFRRIEINYRASDNTPCRPAPELLAPVEAPAPGTRVLLVDDVTVTGQTFAVARIALIGCQIATLAFKGSAADSVLFPEIANCVQWPWKP